MKHQAPKTKLQAIPNHQASSQTVRLPFVVWNLELLWSLRLGEWRFTFWRV